MVAEKGSDPLCKIRAYAFVAEEREEGRGLHIVKSTFYVKEQGGNFVVEVMKEFDVVLEYKSSLAVLLPASEPQWRGWMREHSSA